MWMLCNVDVMCNVMLCNVPTPYLVRCIGDCYQLRYVMWMLCNVDVMCNVMLCNVPTPYLVGCIGDCCPLRYIMWRVANALFGQVYW